MKPYSGRRSFKSSLSLGLALAGLVSMAPACAQRSNTTKHAAAGINKALDKYHKHAAQPAAAVEAPAEAASDAVPVAVATAPAPAPAARAAAATPAPAAAAAKVDDAAATLAAAAELPTTFSALKLFSGAVVDQPIDGLTPYNVKVTLWSDGLGKQRFVYVPSDKQIAFDASTKRLVFPIGSILVKHFVDGDTPVETRVLVRSTDGTWKMASYQWGDNGDATRVDNPTITTAAAGKKGYRLPSQAECQLCHATSSPMVLGFQPDQINGAALDVTTTPLQELAAIPGALTRLFAPGVVDAIKAVPSRPDPNDTTLTTSLRARAYMDLNCSTCHNPTGDAKFLDFTLATGLTTDYPSSLLAFQRVVPGSLANSVIWQKYTDPVYRMPPVSLYQDPLGYQLLHDWLSAWPGAAPVSGPASPASPASPANGAGTTSTGNAAGTSSSPKSATPTPSPSNASGTAASPKSTTPSPAPSPSNASGTAASPYHY